MTLTKKDFWNLRHGCMYKRPLPNILAANIHLAGMLLRDNRKGDHKFEVYKCEFEDHFHIGHPGGRYSQPAFWVQKQKIKLAKGEAK